MEVENPNVKKVDDILEIIDLLEKKGEAHKESVLANIDALDEELTMASKILSENNGVATETLLAKISENLLRKRPLANINMSNKKVYKYVSKLGKRIEKLKSYPDRNLNFHNIDFDHKALKEAIAEYIVYYSVDHNQEQKLEDLDDICDEMGLVDPELIKEKIAKMQDVQKVDKLIKERNIDEFIKWLSVNESKLNDIKSKIPMMSYQILIMKEADNGKDLMKIRELCRQYACKFQQNKAQMKQFVSALVFNNGCINNSDTSNGLTDKVGDEVNKHADILDFLSRKYNSHLDANLKWQTIEANFHKDICAIYHIPAKNPLLEVFKAGVCNYSKFINLNGIGADGNLDEVEINVEIGKEFTYHNIVVCPVSKEICNSDNPPVLLTCGHVISDASAKKLANIGGNPATKKFKCPVCPSEQTYGKLRVLKIDK